MPVIRGFKLSLDTGNLIQRQGISEQSISSKQITKILNDLLILVDQSHLIRPAIKYELYHINNMTQDQIYLSNNQILPSKYFPVSFIAAEEIAIAIGTIGSSLENKVTELFNNNEQLRALLLDGIGNGAIDSLIEEICRIITKEALLLNYKSSGPLGPGMSEIPIEAQSHLYKLAHAEEINVHLTSRQEMSPRKSISIMIGIGSEVGTWTMADICKQCNFHKTCHYKLQATR